MMISILFLCNTSNVYGQYGSQSPIIDSLFLELNNSMGKERVDILNSLAYYITLSDPDKATELTNEAIEISFNKNYQLGMAIALQRIGIISYRRGFSAKSIKVLMQAYDIFKTLNDSFQLSVTNRCIGNAYCGFEDYDKGVEYYIKAVEYSDSLKHPKTYATNVHSLGYFSSKNGNFSDAISYCKRAIHIFEKLDYDFGVAGTYVSLGTIYIEQGDYANALIYLQKALPQYEKINDKTSYGSNLIQIATVYKETGQIKKAKSHALKALAISQEVAGIPNIAVSSQLLYEIYKSENNLRKALEYLELNNKMSEKLLNRKMIQEIERVENDRLIVKAEIEKELLFEQNKHISLEMKNQRNTMYLYLMGFIITLFIGVILSLINRKRKIANKLIYIQKEKIQKQANLLAESNDLKKTLLDIISHDLKGSAGSILGLSELLLEEEDNKLVNGIHNSSKKLIGQIENASRLSSIVLGDIIVKEDLNLRKLISDMLEEYDDALSKINMEVELSIPNELSIYANPIISEIFINYISNAIKYASSGHKLNITYEQFNHDIKISFCDFGETIPVENRTKIFSRKTQLMKRSSGQGLGLAIVKSIANSHYGEVGVIPNQPKGNIFYLLLPKRMK